MSGNRFSADYIGSLGNQFNFISLIEDFLRSKINYMIIYSHCYRGVSRPGFETDLLAQITNALPSQPTGTAQLA